MLIKITGIDLYNKIQDYPISKIVDFLSRIDGPVNYYKITRYNADAFYIEFGINSGKVLITAYPNKEINCQSENAAFIEKILKYIKRAYNLEFNMPE